MALNGGPGRRPCLECPYGGLTEPGSPHVRCLRCRREHATAKAADAQWDRRARNRQQVNDRRRRDGYPEFVDQLVRPRERTPSWDQRGRPVAGPPRLTALQAQDLRHALADLIRAANAVHAALVRVSG